MKIKNISRINLSIFSLVAIFHLWRATARFPVNIGAV